MREVPLYIKRCSETMVANIWCEDRVLDGPASGGEGSKGKN
jgi:hypothetical protein